MAEGRAQQCRLNIRKFLSHPADVGGGDVAAMPPGVSLLVISKAKHFQSQTLMANPDLDNALNDEER